MGFFSDEEVQNSDGELKTTSIDGLDKEPEQETKAEKPVDKPADSQNTESDALPQKYRGKSIEDVIRMHVEAEKLIHKHADEVGFARRMAEQAVALQQPDKSSQAKQTDADSDDSLEYFADPKAAVRKVVDTHPDVVAAKEFTLNQRKQQSYNAVKAAVGDPAEIFQDPDFVTWVQASPFRGRALQYADQSMDADAAIEILNNFKSYKASKAVNLAAQNADMKEKTKNAKNAGIVDGGGPGVSSETIYRRADLIKLQNTDPDRYERLQPQIMKAYAEGRIR